jgi:hypothetical protein
MIDNRSYRDKSPEYDGMLSKYTTISSSACSSVKGASNDDSNKGLLDLVSSKSCLPPEREPTPTNTIGYNQVEPTRNVQIKSRKPALSFA